MFSWLQCLSSFISRRMRFASTRSRNTVFTFLIATERPVLVSVALATTPYAPCPMVLRFVYRSSMVKACPPTSSYVTKAGIASRVRAARRRESNADKSLASDDADRYAELAFPSRVGARRKALTTYTKNLTKPRLVALVPRALRQECSGRRLGQEFQLALLVAFPSRGRSRGFRGMVFANRRASGGFRGACGRDRKGAEAGQSEGSKEGTDEESIGGEEKGREKDDDDQRGTRPVYSPVERCEKGQPDR